MAETDLGVSLFVIVEKDALYESKIFNYLSNIVKLHRLLSFSNHPQTNGEAERIDEDHNGWSNSQSS